MKMTNFGVAAAVCGLIVAGVGASHAQVVGAKGARAGLRGKAARQAGGKHQGQLAQLLAQLTLTPDQKKQIAGIELGAKKQAQAIQQNASLSAADKKAQEKTLGKETRKQIGTVLTPAQKQQLKQLIAQRRAQKTGGATLGAVSPAASSTTAPKTGAAASPGSNAPKTAGTKPEDDDDLDGVDELA